MADRTLAYYTERAEYGAYSIDVQRSASGRPDLVVTIERSDDDAVTIVIEDADQVLDPVMQWLASRRQAQVLGGNE